MQTTAELVAGRELDALVDEKVMGTRDIVRHLSTTEPGIEIPCIHQVPPYSTDIADAWKIVEHMKAAGMEIQILYPSGAIFEWSVAFDNPFDAPFAKAETAPLAICRAALAAVSRWPHQFTATVPRS
jgi:hypothetical protein